ncbi:MAG: methyltransferase domain-containing protein [Roseburia sp.]|nr:methyltransferase domain-containing protein [Roseburia sp.]
MQNRSNINKNAATYAALQTDRAVFDALRAVFIDGAYCAQAITRALRTVKDIRAHAFVTSAFYGVLDSNVRLEKMIRGLCAKPPEKTASVVLKIGLYYLLYADMPDYAAVNRAVELSKHVGAYSGFINAVLKKSKDYVPEFKTELERFSYEHNAPEWLCGAVISDYGETRAASLLDARLPQKTHIRPVKNRIAPDEFKATARGGEFTEYGCYCDKSALDRFEQGSYAVQSLSSMRAVHAYIDGITHGSVLDLCAAPGGKSVYLSELGDFKITACDIYPHKIELMRGYAKKLGARINTQLNDATVLNEKFVGAFDVVIADCPCSGTGTLKTKPDVMIKRKPTDLPELCALQSKILDVAAAYVRVGGVLCYSTCSILKCENQGISDKFASLHPEFKKIDSTTLLPDTDKCDGFFIARFKKERDRT